ncbi:PEGA domain-containing protein [Methanophagales archaeon]|nr:PEGA domain-containing protein [Methanophagales archaeon]
MVLYAPASTPNIEGKKMKQKEDKGENSLAKNPVLKKGFLVVALVTAILLFAAFVAPLNAVLPPHHQKGSIAVYSSPSGATIGLDGPDGAFVGPTIATPHTFTALEPGLYTITLSLAGFYDWTKTVQVTGGRTTNVHATLTPHYTPKATGTISVDSVPPGATIELITPAGLFVGPTVTTPYTFDNVGTGTSTIKLSLAGYHDWSTNVVVTEGGTSYVKATLIPIHTTGSIYVTTSPSGAYIGLDGQWWGMYRTTPDVIADVAQGHHTLELSLDGYQDKRTSVEVSPGETEYVHVTLIPIQATGAIEVTSDPSGATISLKTPHGVFVGPSVKTPHTFTRVEPGICTVTLSLEGYPDWTTDVTVRPGETEYVHKTFDWLPAP